MPGTTPSRGYPYPVDTDLINTAVDIQLLAEAVGADVENGFSQIFVRDNAQDARIDKIAEELLGTWGNTVALDTRVTRLEEWDAVIRPQVVAHDVSINKLYTEQIVVGGFTLLTTDANGYGSIFFPTGSFQPGFPVSVMIGSSGTNTPGTWNEGRVYGTEYNGFGSHWAYFGGTPYANNTVGVFWIATGTRVA